MKWKKFKTTNLLINFELAIPENWQFKAEGKAPIVFSFFNPKGSGAFQFSLYRIPLSKAKKSFSTVNELGNVLKDKSGEKEKITVFRTEYMGGAYAAAMNEKFCWRYWILSDGERMGFFTYNCKRGVEKKEKKEIDGIIESFRFV